MTLSKMTFSLVTLSIIGLSLITPKHDRIQYGITQHNDNLMTLGLMTQHDNEPDNIQYNATLSMTILSCMTLSILTPNMAILSLM
jgi:hypothetical protein